MAWGRPLSALVVTAALVTSCAAGDQGGAAPRPAPAETSTSTTVGGAEVPSSEVPAADPPPVATRPGRLDDLTAVSVARPVSVAIDAIDVAAEVVPVGVEPDGDMEVPSADDVGWYRFGPQPGAPGSAVLAAHVDYDGREGAFFRLADLAPGDTVTVTDGDGRTAGFVVEEVRQVAKEDLGETDVFDRRGEPRLSLITCGGDFDRDRRSYRDNVVVTAVPAGGGR